MKKRIFWGILLTLLGIFLLLSQYQDLHISVWFFLPVITFCLSVYEQVTFFAGHGVDSGKLVSSGFFLGLTVTLTFCALWGWGWMRELYPILFLGIAAGVLEEILFTKGRSGSWFVACVFALAGVFLLMDLEWRTVWTVGGPILLIALGVSLLWKPHRKKYTEIHTEEPDNHA